MKKMILMSLVLFCVSVFSETVTLTDLSVKKGEWVRLQQLNPVSAKKMKVTVFNVKGDPDLYVQEGDEPTTNTRYCRPYQGGGVDEICEVSEQEEVQYYVAIHGYSDSTFDLKVEYDNPSVEELLAKIVTLENKVQQLEDKLLTCEEPVSEPVTFTDCNDNLSGQMPELGDYVNCISVYSQDENVRVQEVDYELYLAGSLALSNFFINENNLREMDAEVFVNGAIYQQGTELTAGTHIVKVMFDGMSIAQGEVYTYKLGLTANSDENDTLGTKALTIKWVDENGVIQYRDLDLGYY